MFATLEHWPFYSDHPQNDNFDSAQADICTIHHGLNLLFADSDEKTGHLVIVTALSMSALKAYYAHPAYVSRAGKGVWVEVPESIMRIGELYTFVLDPRTPFGQPCDSPEIWYRNAQGEWDIAAVVVFLPS